MEWKFRNLGGQLDFKQPRSGPGFPGTGKEEIRPELQAGDEGGAEAAGIYLTLLSCPIPIPRELDGWVFVELDVGSEGNADGAQIQEVLHTVISSGSVASYVTSPQGFQFRRLGTGEPILGPGALRFSDSYGSPSSVHPHHGLFWLGACTPLGAGGSLLHESAPWVSMQSWLGLSVICFLYHEPN